MTINSRARVELTLEIYIRDNWSSDATVEQIYKQAAESAKVKLYELFRNIENRINGIGEIKVTMILVDEKR